MKSLAEKKNGIKKMALFLVLCLLIQCVCPYIIYGCYYYEKSGVLYCRRSAGCNDDELGKAKHVVIDTRLTGSGVKKLKENPDLETVTIKDLSNLSEAERIAIFPYLVKGNPSLAAVLFAYEDYYESFGNDGTKLYQKVMKDYAPDIKTLRSCATVVSAALNAAGIMDYDSAATAGLVDYFEESPEWINMGAVSDDNIIKPGDIIFIDRKSHAAEYTSGEMEDEEYTTEEEYVYEYTGGYDSTGHKNYQTQDPTGSSYEVFCPDQDGDGEVGEWESEYWKVYWERVNPDTKYVPPYDYYYVWEEEAKAKEEEEKAEKERERREEEEAQKKTRRKVVPGRIIHDHIFIWTGNEIIRQVYPDSTGNIISGSYTENYRNARSAAVSKYNFTGDFRVYRYLGPVKPYEMTVSDDEIPIPVEALKQETWHHGKEALGAKGNNSWLRISLAKMRMDMQGDDIENTVSGDSTIVGTLDFNSGLKEERRKRFVASGGERMWGRVREIAEGEDETEDGDEGQDADLVKLLTSCISRKDLNGSESFEQASAGGD